MFVKIQAALQTFPPLSWNWLGKKINCPDTILNCSQIKIICFVFFLLCFQLELLHKKQKTPIKYLGNK